MVRAHLEKHGDGDDLEIRTAVARAIDASPSLRNKKDLIEAFVESMTVEADVDADWQQFVNKRRKAELGQLIAEEQLDPAATKAFIEAAFRDGAIQPTGTAIAKLLPPMSRFTPDGAHAAKKASALARLTAFFERFFGLG